MPNDEELKKTIQVAFPGWGSRWVVILDFVKAVRDAERERAARCVQRAREGEADTDLRSIIAAIRSGADPDAE